MIRYIKYAFLGSVGLVLVTLALANREFVSLQLLPSEIGGFFGFNATIDLPLFVVIYGGIVAGLLIGFLWEWIREYKYRTGAERAQREVGRLEREVSKLKGASATSEDDVLNLLDDSRALR